MPDVQNPTNPTSPTTKPIPRPAASQFQSNQSGNTARSHSANLLANPYVMGGITVAVILFMGYQQYQISQLTGQLTSVSDSLKSSDVKTRLESQEQSLGELNTRLAYLDSKINATDQKAQEALTRIKSHEDKDVIGKLVDGIKQTLGIR